MNENNIEMVTKDIQHLITIIIKEFQFCQEINSDVILQFSEIYYSFPYFGYIHEPISE